MGNNIEIKARLARNRVDHVRAEALARSTRPPETLHQVDTFYRAARGRLKLRRFEDGTGELIAYERPDRAGPKRSSYTIVPLQDPGPLDEALAGSLGVRGVVEKRREVFHVGPTRVHVDDVVGLGTFLELEVVLRPGQAAEEGETIAAELMDAFGIGTGSLVESAYIDLTEQTPAAGRGGCRHLLPTLAGICLLSSPASAWDGAAWADYTPFIRPLTGEIRAHLVQIRLAGETAGREPGRLGQIGDSITETSAYFRNVALNGPSGNETGHDYDPVRSWLAYNGTAPADANSFYRDHGKGEHYGNRGGWCVPDAVAAGHPPHGVTTGDGVTPGNYSWALVMFGTNDIDDAGWTVGPWKDELRAFVQGYVDLGVVPVLSTIPPEAAHVGDSRVDAANGAIRELADELVLLWVDYHALILHYQPADWHGTLISADGTHPSAGGGGADFSQDGLTTTDGYAARTKLTLDVAELLRAEIFDFDPTGVGSAVESESWGGLKGRFRRPTSDGL